MNDLDIDPDLDPALDIIQFLNPKSNVMCLKDIQKIKLAAEESRERNLYDHPQFFDGHYISHWSALWNDIPHAADIPRRRKL